MWTLLARHGMRRPEAQRALVQLRLQSGPLRRGIDRACFSPLAFQRGKHLKWSSKGP